MINYELVRLQDLTKQLEASENLVDIISGLINYQLVRLPSLDETIEASENLVDSLASLGL